ncbi:MAG: YggT family protein [Pseudomonadota bacterium]
MGTVATNVSVFLIHTLFMLYLLIAVLRFLLAWVRADFYNPLSQFLVSATNPVLTPLRRLLPSMGPVDTASIVLILGIKLLELVLLTTVAGGEINLLILFITAILQVVELIIYIFMFSIIIQVVISWVSPGTQHYGNPMASILYSLNEPLLRQMRRILPKTGMIDFSPMAVIIALNVALIIIKSLFRY